MVRKLFQIVRLIDFLSLAADFLLYLCLMPGLIWVFWLLIVVPFGVQSLIYSQSVGIGIILGWFVRKFGA